MNYLRVLSRIVCFGAALLIIAGRAGAQDKPISPVRDYWPTVDWKTSTPAQQGMNSKVLAKIKPYIEKKFPAIRSVLIVRHGYLVYERYFQYFNRDYKQGDTSITQSISSALVGIALKEGYLKNLDQKLVDFFPEYMTPDIDPRVRKITLKHLLTMSSGFHKYDLFSKSIQERIRQKPIHEPGDIFLYDVDAVDLLSPILTKTTHMSLLDFAKKHLFNPIGISEFTWDLTTYPPFDKKPYSPYYPAGLGISLKPRDMAKFGYLYLNNGVWNGKQIVPSDFVKESTQKQIKTNILEGPEYLDYGYLWWEKKIQRYPVYIAWGYGGQIILVSHDLDMVMVITSGGNDGSNEENLIERFIIPSILK
jgi:CubicO group peptidase (beta-lactamase class C family)